jgi:hypothetical protein
MSIGIIETTNAVMTENLLEILEPCNKQVFLIENLNDLSNFFKNGKKKIVIIEPLIKSINFWI